MGPRCGLCIDRSALRRARGRAFARAPSLLTEVGDSQARPSTSATSPRAHGPRKPCSVPSRRCCFARAVPAGGPAPSTTPCRLWQAAWRRPPQHAAGVAMARPRYPAGGGGCRRRSHQASPERHTRTAAPARTTPGCPPSCRDSASAMVGAADWCTCARGWRWAVAIMLPPPAAAAAIGLSSRRCCFLALAPHRLAHLLGGHCERHLAVPPRLPARCQHALLVVRPDRQGAGAGPLAVHLHGWGDGRCADSLVCQLWLCVGSTVRMHCCSRRI